MPRVKAIHKPTTKRVRCLGPGPDHTFVSPDHIRVRLCDRCRQLVTRCAPLFSEVVEVSRERNMRRGLPA